MNPRSPHSPRSQAVASLGSAALGEPRCVSTRVLTDLGSPPSSPSRRSLILEVRNRYRQGDPRPVETVLSHHPEASHLESLVFDLIHEEFFQRDRDGKLCGPEEFDQRFSGWGIHFRDFREAKELIENHGDTLGALSQVPECLQNFEVLGLLGRGNFGQVYLASQPTLGDRLVVLKVSEHGAREANTLGRLDHPNIVPVYSVHHDADSKLTVVCMPYLGSATLEDVAEARRLQPALPQSAQVIWQSIQDTVIQDLHAVSPKSPPRCGSYVNAVLDLGRQLAQALALIHEKGIFHRDLKPSNVLMTPTGRPMLLDFHLSFHKQLPDKRIAGTIVYMPPEQLAALHPENKSSSPTLVDERADLFSLGVILYELLTGVYPFGSVPPQEKAEEAGATWYQKQKAGPSPLRRINPRVDAAAARLIERCLAFDRKDRPRNARELAAELGRLVSPIGRTRRWASLRVPLLIALSCLGLTMTAGSAYLLVPKEPYSVRQLHAGWDRYRQGRYEDALTYLMRSVEADRSNAQAHFARGRTFLRLGHVESALADFEAADRLFAGQDAPTKACLGYCYNLVGIDEMAIKSYEQAQELNFATAEVLNNWGYTYTVWRKPQTRPDDAFDRANELLTQSLKLNDRFQPAYYNRARADISRALLNHGYLPRQGLADIRKAIELGPISATLYRDAARLTWLLAMREGRQDSEVFSFLNAAIENGLDPMMLKRDHIFHDLGTDPRFLALLKKKADPSLLQEPTKLVDPIKD